MDSSLMMYVMLGIPVGTTLAIVFMIVVPLVTYLLYRIDKSRGDGHVTVIGRR